MTIRRDETGLYVICKHCEKDISGTVVMHTWAKANWEVNDTFCSDDCLEAHTAQFNEYCERLDAADRMTYK